MNGEPQELLSNLENLHTTELGVERIRRNLSLDCKDVVAWCREQIQKKDAVIVREGKNWYVEIAGCTITVNAYSNTIITAHKKKVKNKTHMEEHKMAKISDRFEKTYSQGTMNVTEIWVDRETGVNYVFHVSGYAGGLTPLLDREGKPVISPIMNG